MLFLVLVICTVNLALVSDAFAGDEQIKNAQPKADTILTNARIYTLKSVANGIECGRASA
jgi:hypothetical protein